ncbi:MAG: 3-deoxy-manno-octulosonate cytidylyltransferase [Desulfobacterales bacterium]|nr:3-deoxy-manno-octulosonate cytidylyltransferase [Desulfobacterales bacterium]
MDTSSKIIGIIPARYQSSRFPGKPLAEIFGKPMFWHVYTQAKKCTLFSDIVVATDDDRIYTSAKQHQVPVIMTASTHQSGTDRVFEAAKHMNVSADTIVVNIQGDEPALNPDMLTELVLPFKDPQLQVCTLARWLDENEALIPDRVKVVMDNQNDALYFSRFPIPYPANKTNIIYYGHIGLYAFRFYILEQFVSWPLGRLEQSEKLEQLRLLEHGISIHVVITEHKSMGVDRPEDIEIVKRMMGDTNE